MKFFNGVFVLILLFSSFSQVFAQDVDKVQLFNFTVLSIRKHSENDRFGRNVMYLKYHIYGTNYYSNEIDTFRGLIIIKNLYGDTLKIFRVDNNSISVKKISAREPNGLPGLLMFSEHKEIFDPNDKRNLNIETLDLKQCDIVWKTEYIHFTNGTQTFKDSFMTRKELGIKK